MSVDLEQQRDIGKAYREIADLRGDVKELRVAVIGIDGHNGLRGELRDFIQKFDREYAVRLLEVENRVEEGIAMGKHLYEVERYKPGQCIGKVALDEYVDTMAKKERRSTDFVIEMKKARTAMIGTVAASLIVAVASIIVALVRSEV